MDILRSIMNMLKNLSLTTQDKSIIVRMSTPNITLKIIQKLIEIKKDDYLNSSYLCILLREAINTINIMQ